MANPDWTEPSVWEDSNACPDCGERYQGVSYYCPACTSEKIAQGAPSHDVLRGRS